MRRPAEALDALAATPCGARLLEALPDGAWLVGGAVRDLLLGREPRELDVAVEADVGALAGALGEVVAAHGRFGTATVHAGDCRYDLARTRTETYSAPGALPDVRPAGLDEDLRRRDFTVNAIALRPDGAGGADVRAADHALEDLEARRLRVLHPASFADDPTRLWRLVRYAVRLGFLPEPGTDRLARDAVAGGALETVSGDRLGNELRLALREPRPLDVLHAAQQLGVVRRLVLDPQRAARALDLLPAGEGRRDLVVLGAVLPDAAWADGWGFDGAELRILRRCADLVVPDDRPSKVAEALRGEPLEAVAVAGGPGAAWWLREGRHVRLEIGGEDLLEAGLERGPELGAALRRALDAKLDGLLEGAGAEAELRAALQREDRGVD
ncbi:CCA tRNA nucleotidyltransferase [Conexibacter sp. SYSU D00693]|uniref:CCA tRNA nucleotidyltransferase n=1 Tax=Conexibacter sp. SYSU D00693 TaxID=2812560 RepID=UPI00196B74F9|nr:CCA tRNA nucleotidyltransferase [Conexibacter sp. SYSU D00693]